MSARLLPLLFLLACDGETTSTEPTGFEWPVNTQGAVIDYTALAESSYERAALAAESMQNRMDTLLRDPSPDNLEFAQASWLSARDPYLETEAFRFFGSPIDAVIDDLDAHPIDISRIDYTAEDATAGIVNGEETIDAATLTSLDGITTGYAVVEFLLWGEDRSATAPGERTHRDYEVPEEGPAARNQDRRGLYLTTSVDLLSTTLQPIQAEWVEGSAYQVAFVADPPTAIQNILTGLLVLTRDELATRRVQVVLDSGMAVDEHSRFSDNTRQDLIGSLEGIKNVWIGSNGAFNGVGVRDVLSNVDSVLANTVTQQIETNLTLASELQEPFEAEIDLENEEGRARVQALLDGLRTQETLLGEVFTAFQLTAP